MNRKEINEIKKLYTLKDCAVTRICGCYVGAEKEIKDRWSVQFLSLDEEDLFKYLEIFRTCLAGGLEKNLINIPVALEKEEQLLELRDTRLTDGDVLDNFFQRVIDTYEYVGNYLILVIHDVYDIPGKTSDGIEMEDASEEVYDYILACICPVNLQKPGLGYDREKSTFTHIERDWILSPPQLGILYPAFNSRSEDREAALIYAKNLQQSDKEFVARMLGSSINLTNEEEKDLFESVLQETLGAADLKEVKENNKTLLEYAEHHKDDPEPWKLKKEDMEEILNKSGIREEKRKRLEQVYEGNTGAEFCIENIVNRKSFNIDTRIGNIRMKPEYADEISIMEIDGRSCLVMNILGDITVNGIDIRMEAQDEEG